MLYNGYIISLSRLVYHQYLMSTYIESMFVFSQPQKDRRVYSIEMITTFLSDVTALSF